jgi:hypothetical protein
MVPPARRNVSPKTARKLEVKISSCLVDNDYSCQVLWANSHYGSNHTFERKEVLDFRVRDAQERQLQQEVQEKSDHFYETSQHSTAFLTYMQWRDGSLPPVLIPSEAGIVLCMLAKLGQIAVRRTW